MVLPALPQGYRLRPATTTDRQQIHRLLRNFEREAQRSTRRWQRLSWSIITAVLLWMTVRLGTAVLLLAIVALVSAILWMQVSPLFSEDWKQYWVITEVSAVANGKQGADQDKLIACAKLCRYRHYSLLFNLLVAPAYRQRGFGSALVIAMSQKADHPLYLACYPDRVSFYTRLGFKPIAPAKLSAIVRSDLGIAPYSTLVALKRDAADKLL